MTAPPQLSFSSRKIGRALEKRGCELHSLEHTAENPDVPDWYDAETKPNGRPVEIKGARYRKKCGNTRRRGSFWIQREAHQKLLENGGYYVFIVYRVDPDADDVDDALEVLQRALVPAKFVNPLAGSYAKVGPGHQSEASEATRINWSNLFDDVQLADQRQTTSNGIA